MPKAYSKFTIGALVLVAGITLSGCKYDYALIPTESDQVSINKAWLKDTGDLISDRIKDTGEQFVAGMAASRNLIDADLNLPMDRFYPNAYQAGYGYAERHELEHREIRQIADVLAARHEKILEARSDAKRTSGGSNKRRRRSGDYDIVVVAAAVALGEEFVDAPPKLRQEVTNWMNGSGYTGRHEGRAEHVEKLAEKLAGFLKKDPALLAEIREIINTPLANKDPSELSNRLSRDNPPEAEKLRAVYVDRFTKLPVPDPSDYPLPSDF